MDQAPPIAALEVFHFPIRSCQQFERKVLNTGVGYGLLQGRAPGAGIDQLELLDMQRHGTLRDYFAAKCLDPAEIEEGIEAVELSVDHRLQVFLAVPRTRVEESPFVQEAFRRAWLTAGARVDETDMRISLLTAELNTLRPEVADRRRTLEVIQSSRIMRVSAPVRRLYYRIRPGG